MRLFCFGDCGWFYIWPSGSPFFLRFSFSFFLSGLSFPPLWCNFSKNEPAKPSACILHPTKSRTPRLRAFFFALPATSLCGPRSAVYFPGPVSNKPFFFSLFQSFLVVVAERHLEIIIRSIGQVQLRWLLITETCRKQDIINSIPSRARHFFSTLKMMAKLLQSVRMATPKKPKKKKKKLKGTVACVGCGGKLQIKVVSRRNLIKTVLTALAVKSITRNPAAVSMRFNSNSGL